MTEGEALRLLKDAHERLAWYARLLAEAEERESALRFCEPGPFPRSITKARALVGNAYGGLHALLQPDDLKGEPPPYFTDGRPCDLTPEVAQILARIKLDLDRAFKLMSPEITT